MKRKRDSNEDNDDNLNSEKQIRLLIRAVEEGYLPRVREVFEGGAVDFNRGDGRIPFHNACLTGRLEIVKWMVENGANVEVEHHWFGHRPLHHACRFGHLDVAKYLAEMGADMNAESSSGNRPAHFACRQGHLETVKWLAENGADLSACNKAGRQPLYWACWEGRLEAAKVLIEAGSISMQNAIGARHLCMSHVRIVNLS